MATMSYDQGLITEVAGGRLAGEDGFVLIVMERIGTGKRFYQRLEAGQALGRLNNLLGKFIAYKIDMRVRKLELSAEVPTTNPVLKVVVGATIHYRVSDPQQLLAYEDPLAEFQTWIVDEVASEICRFDSDQLNAVLCRQILLNLRGLPSFGLVVDNVLKPTLEHPEIIRAEAQKQLQHHANLRQQDRDQELDARNVEYGYRKQDREFARQIKENVVNNYVKKQADAAPDALIDEAEGIIFRQRPSLADGNTDTNEQKRIANPATRQSKSEEKPAVNQRKPRDYD